MALVNHEKKEVVFKIVYCGPGMSGKTTNLSYIRSQIDPSQRSELVAFETSCDRTISFDLFPVNTVVQEGYRTKFQIYTVPGLVSYDATRQLVMKGVDGVVFVADSRIDSFEENRRAFQMMEKILGRNGSSLDQLPLVLQYNKRDVSGAATLEDLENVFNGRARRLTSFEAVASSGYNVLATLNAVSQLVLHRFFEVVGLREAVSPNPPPGEARAASAPIPERSAAPNSEGGPEQAGHPDHAGAALAHSWGG